MNVLPYSWLWHSAALEFSVTVFSWFITQRLLKATKKAFLLFTLLEKRRKTAICICSSPFYTISCLCKCKVEIHYGIGSKYSRVRTKHSRTLINPSKPTRHQRPKAVGGASERSERGRSALFKNPLYFLRDAIWRQHKIFFMCIPDLWQIGHNKLPSLNWF